MMTEYVDEFPLHNIIMANQADTDYYSQLHATTSLAMLRRKCDPTQMRTRRARRHQNVARAASSIFAANIKFNLLLLQCMTSFKLNAYITLDRDGLVTHRSSLLASYIP